MADIFISYASEDRDRIEPFVDLLEERGWSVWWDRDLYAGSSFEEKIQQALEDARCVIVTWSDSAIRSVWCRDEAQEGLDRGVLVPLRIDDVRPPLGFRSLQTASLVGWPQQVGELENLLTGIRECIGTSSNARPAAPKTENAIAILPFRNMSSDPDQEFLSDGIAEDILNELAKTSRNLIVRPSSSSFALKGESLSTAAIGERLAVTHVLEGSVQRSGNRVRVTVQLSEVAGDRGLWSERYDRDLTDIFEVQDDITRKVLYALNIQFNVKPNPRYSVDLEAYEAFLRGIYCARTGEYAVADDWYQKSVDLDPNNPDVWAERSRLLEWQMHAGLAPNTGELRKNSDEYIERALAIDPSHWARARKVMHTFVEGRQYQNALNELVDIVREHPNSWDSVMVLAQALGTIDPRSSAYEKAARRFSLLTRDYGMEQSMLMDNGRFGEAHQSIERNQSWDAQYQAARLAAIEGDLQRLEAIVSKRGLSRFNRIFFTALRAYLAGDFEEARDIVLSAKRAEGYQPFLKKHYIALIERDLETALEFYRKAVEACEPRAILEHCDTCFMNTVFPEFVAYPAYQQFLKEIGLDSESTAKIVIPELPF